MVLGIAEDFTSNVSLDKELTSLPSSGIYLNSGVHTSITVENILNFLPKTKFSFVEWDSETEYEVFSDSRNRKDVVSSDNKIYQCIKQNTGIAVSDEEYWLETNIESLRIKIFLQKVEDKINNDLNLDKKLVNNQYLYENGDVLTDLPNDYSGWVIQPKGSDYISFKINEISLQKEGTTPVNLYVINQKTLIDTITVTPNNGEINFQPLDLTLKGKGEFKLVIDSTEVYTSNSSVDPYRYDAFTARMVNGRGDSPETSTYTYSTLGMGLGLNLSAYLDASTFVENNLDLFASYLRATFELMVFEMFLSNSHNRSNDVQRIQLDREYLGFQTTNMQGESSIKRYVREKKKVLEAMDRVFDTQLSDQPKKLTVKISSF